MNINGLPLPRELLDLIEAGRWRAPADPSGLDQLFPERGEFCCYSFRGMEFETAAMYRDDSPRWRGTPDPGRSPGDIDPKLAVLIADLGLGYDQPIALDYHLSRERPRVITLSWDTPDPPVPWEDFQSWGQGERHYDQEMTLLLGQWNDTNRQGGWNRWVEIAPDFATFAQMIGL